MEHKARCTQRPREGARRRIASVLAGSALAVLALAGCQPGAGLQDPPAQLATADQPTGGEPAATGMQSTRTSGSSPRQLAVPYAYEDHGQQMFVLQPARAPLDSPWPAAVRMNREAAERAATTGSMEVGLPDGTRYPVVFERVKQGPRGNMTWIGRVASPAGDLAAVLTYGRDGVFGVLPTPEGRILQVKTSHGQTYLEPDPGLIPPGVDPEAPFPDYVIPPPASPDMLARLAPTAPLPPQAVGDAVVPGTPTPWAQGQAASVPTAMMPLADGSLTEITVLGVYTTNLVEERGSAEAAESEFINLLEVSNQAHIDSGTTVRFALAGLLETDYSAHVFNSVVLSDLAGNRLEDGLDIHAARDAHGADLVALLRPYAPDDTSCGIAYLSGAGLQGPSAWASSGYSVTACGSYTMAHELGHNLGSHHDRETATTDGVLGYGAFEFSFGHRQSTSPAFATIMAYSQAGQSRLGYFSAPANNLCLGVACGVADISDNARSINLMAETISRFRDPPNTISVMDARALEPNEGSVQLNFVVRLSSPAPAGGVGFDIATVGGGTATPGSDYVARSGTGQVIPEGEREWSFQVEVLPDLLVEGDETVHVRLSNVSGMQVYDGEAVGVIVDDDPRVKVAGSLVFPDGASRPSQVEVYAQPSFEGRSEWQHFTAVAPDYRFEFRVKNGAQVRLSAGLPGDSPWLDAVALVNKVDGDVTQNLYFERAIFITGKVTWPAGDPAPGEQISLIAWNSLGDGYGYYHYAYPPNFEYSIKARNLTAIALEVRQPPAPYVTQRVETFTRGDTVQDLPLSTAPSLSITHQRVEEGPAGAARTIPLQVRLSVPAPPGGVSFELVTEDGTASGESDYLPESQSVTISEGNSWFGTSVVVFGDDRHEPDEYFKVVARNITGAHMPTPGVVWIANDDPEPLQVSHDFDGDGLSDLVWHHSRNGRAALWSGARHVQYLTTVTDTRWHIAGVGDFDRDGRADLFWRHGGSGLNVIWRSGNHGRQLRVQAVANLDWTLAGVGDFDGDGQSDLLWRNVRSGANVIWRGADYRSQRAVTGVTDLAWQVAGVGDFDADGRSDILWRHARTGANVIWREGNYRRQQAVTGVTDTRWTVAGIGDFDGDGKDDVLWRHGGNGTNAIWRGADYRSQKPVTAVTNVNWQVAAVADYDGDGVADIAWRDLGTGANAVWRAGNYRSQMPVAQVSDRAWRIVP